MLQWPGFYAFFTYAAGTIGAGPLATARRVRRDATQPRAIAYRLISDSWYSVCAMSADVACVCSHEWSVHDAHGCCAFLDAYPQTKGQLRYCSCKTPAASGRAAAARAAAAADDRAGVSGEADAKAL